MFKSEFLGGYVLGVVLTSIVITTIMALTPEGPGYKQGQIDAINGVVKYELIENPDQTKTWRRIKE